MNPEQIAAENAKLAAKNAELEKELATAKAAGTENQLKLANLETEVAELKATLAKQPAPVNVDEIAAKAAAAAIAKHGIRGEALEDKPKAAVGVLEQYNAITDPEQRAAFVAKNAAALRAIVLGVE